MLVVLFCFPALVQEMPLLLNFAFVIAGFIMLFVGGEGLVRGSVAIARRLGLSTLLVSVVIVGFGTSMPEMLVSILSAFKGVPDIALGNVIGSNIANILLILGVSALLFPIATGGNVIVRDTLCVIAASAVMVGLAYVGMLGFWTGVAFLAVLAAYLAYSYRVDRKKNIAEGVEMAAHLEEEFETEDMKLGRSMVYALGGMAVLVIGAQLLVVGAVDIARDFGVSEAVIGLSLIAVGTSLPELATGIIAAIRRHSDVIIGNILGSNIFNIFSILGVTALIIPIPFTGQLAQTDVWIMFAVAALLLPFIITGKRISRLEGGVFLALYVAYLGWLFLNGMTTG